MKRERNAMGFRVPRNVTLKYDQKQDLFVIRFKGTPEIGSTISGANLELALKEANSKAELFGLDLKVMLPGDINFFNKEEN